jgi:hypothetical protein
MSRVWYAQPTQPKALMSRVVLGMHACKGVVQESKCVLVASGKESGRGLG